MEAEETALSSTDASSSDHFLVSSRALHYPVVPKFSPVALLSQIAGIFFSLLVATEVAPQGNVVPVRVAQPILRILRERCNELPS